MTLDKLPRGKAGVVLTVSGQCALRQRLLDLGLVPGTRVLVRKTAPFNDPIEISLRGYELTLRRREAAQIQVAADEG